MFSFDWQLHRGKPLVPNLSLGIAAKQRTSLRDGKAAS